MYTTNSIYLTDVLTKPNNNVFIISKFLKPNNQKNTFPQLPSKIRFDTYKYIYEIINNNKQLIFGNTLLSTTSLIKILLLILRVSITISSLSYFFKNKITPKALIVDHNFGTFLLPLLISSFRNNKKVIVKTHGIFFHDNLEIFPTIGERFIVKNLREHILLQDLRIKSKGYYNFNRIKIFKYREKALFIKNIPVFDILILGKSGSLWFTDILFKRFQTINLTKEKVVFRAHPRDTKFNNLNTNATIKYFNFSFIRSSNKTLDEDILSSKFVISSSMDSLRPCLLNGKPTIYLVPQGFNAFMLENIFGLFLSYNGDDLQELINEVGYVKSKDILNKENITKILYCL